MKEWFESWFDTRYYHILYKDRDYSEAEQFMRNLVQFLEPGDNSKVLDLACGKGRHALFLNELGLHTTGVDLSQESILEAKKMEREGLRFFQHDMRDSIPQMKFDFIFNLFTSFGYFESDKDNLRTVGAMASNLLQDGVLVIDFLNIDFVKKQMKKYEEKEVEGIVFKISKKIENGYIIKDIQFEDGGKRFNYSEKVQGLKQSDFENLLTKNGFSVKHYFGNYELDEYHQDSERLIIIAKKIV